MTICKEPLQRNTAQSMASWYNLTRRMLPRKYEMSQASEIMTGDERELVMDAPAFQIDLLRVDGDLVSVATIKYRQAPFERKSQCSRSPRCLPAIREEEQPPNPLLQVQDELVHDEGITP